MIQSLLSQAYQNFVMPNELLKFGLTIASDDSKEICSRDDLIEHCLNYNPQFKGKI